MEEKNTCSLFIPNFFVLKENNIFRLDSKEIWNIIFGKPIGKNSISIESQDFSQEALMTLAAFHFIHLTEEYKKIQHVMNCLKDKGYQHFELEPPNLEKLRAFIYSFGKNEIKKKEQMENKNVPFSY